MIASKQLEPTLKIGPDVSPEPLIKALNRGFDFGYTAVSLPG